jgi:predicted enzyme related to lactoylglutathione lyase
MSETASGHTLSFTKLVVGDLEAMVAYYCEVFGYHVGHRDRFDQGLGGEPIDEISLTPNAETPYGNLTLLERLESRSIVTDETVLGFTTHDLDALIERALRSGGTLMRAVRELPDHGIRVAFVRDPEGHINELVEMRR